MTRRGNLYFLFHFFADKACEFSVIVCCLFALALKIVACYAIKGYAKPQG